jgi:hypothetical protein
MKLFGSKYTGSIIKLYKVVTSENCHVSVFDLTKLCLEFVQKCTGESLNQIYKNYNSKPLSINKFYEYIKDKPTVDFSVYKSGNKSEIQTTIQYGNNILNKTEKYKKTTEYKKEIDLIDLLIYLNNYFIEDEKIIIEFINKIYTIINFDYGYINDLKKCKDIFTETFEDRKKLREVKSGYIPKIYPHNILNHNQMKSINIKDKIDINNYLIYVKGK